MNTDVSWSPSITADARTLYFTSLRPGGYGDLDVWYSEWDGHDWGPAKNCGSKVNSGGTEKSAFITPDGKRLYLSSDRFGSISGFDEIWYCDKTDSGWSDAVNLGEKVNVGCGCLNPFVTADGLTLYCTQWRETWDTYLSHWNGSEWSAVERVDIPGGEVYNDWGASLSPDGNRLFFSSPRDTTLSRIWVSEWVAAVDERGKAGLAAVPPLNDHLAVLRNPARGDVAVRYTLPVGETGTLFIYDATGRVVRSVNLQSGTCSLQLPALPPGVHFLRLEAGGQSATAKVVKLE